MPVKKLEDGTHWINDKNNRGCPWVGPYDTRREALEDRDGLRNTYARERWLIDD